MAKRRDELKKMAEERKKAFMVDFDFASGQVFNAVRFLVSKFNIYLIYHSVFSKEIRGCLTLHTIR